MGRKFVSGISVIIFLTVELCGVQGADAQRLRNLLRRNTNNCNNCCDGCGVASESMGSLVQGSVVQGSMIDNSSAGTMIESSANYGSPMMDQSFQASNQPYNGESYGEIVSAPMFEQPSMQSMPSQPYAESYAEPFTQSMAPIQNMPMEQSITMATPSMTTPYFEGMSTTEYPISNVATPTEVMPVNYEMAQGCTSCGNGNIGTAAWSEGQIVDGGSVSMPMESQGSYEGGIINDGTVIRSGTMQGEVLGCANGDCGGSTVIDGGSYGGGVIYEGAAIQGGSISEGSIISGGIEGVNVTAATEYSTGNPAETIISSEIISESPIEASESTGDETTIESPPADASTTDGGTTDGGTADSVPDAPATAPEDDGKEA